MKRNNKAPKISLIDYVAYNNTPEARRMIVKFGQVPARSMSELRSRMIYVVNRFGEDALKEIAKIHPDRELITDFGGNSKMTGEKGNGDYLYNNSCGCNDVACNGQCDCKCNNKKSEHSNFVTNYREPTSCADGSGSKPVNYMPVIIISVFVLGIALVASGEKYRAYE